MEAEAATFSARRRRKDDVAYYRTIHGHTVPFYRVEIETGELLHVPRHVKRILGARNRGWQIVIKRKKIADINYYENDNGNPQEALRRCVVALENILRDIPWQTNTRLKNREGKGKLVPTGVPGVRVSWRMHRVRAVYQLYVEARAGRKDGRMWGRYVATEATLSEARLRSVLFEGMRVRRSFFDQDLMSGHLNPYTRHPRKIGVDLDRVRNQLIRTKNHDSHLLDDLIEKAVDRVRRGHALGGFSGQVFSSHRVTAFGRSFQVPNFITFEGNQWCVSVILKNNALYEDAIDVESDPQEALDTLLYEVFEAMVFATPDFKARERLHG